MKQVYDNLYVGDVNDADNSKRHEENNIKYIFNLSGAGPETNSAPSYETIRTTDYIHFPIADDGSNPDFMMETIIETARRMHQQAQEENVAMLVHCAVGSSRSVAVAAALMSLENGKRVQENVSRIKKVRPIANPETNLLRQVGRITADMYQN